MKYKIRTNHSENYPAADIILDFINEEFSDIAELDPELLDANLKYGSSAYYSDKTCWDFRKERVDYLVDNFSVFKCILIIDPDFRSSITEAVRTIAKLYDNKDISGIRHTIYDFEEYYTFDLDTADEDDIYPFIDRARFSYISHPDIIPLLDNIDYEIASLDRFDRINLGIIASGFLYLLIAFEISDLLYFSFKSRVDFSREVYLDKCGIEPPFIM